MTDQRTRRWLVAAPDAAREAGDRRIVLRLDGTADPLDVPFHEAVAAELQRADEVDVWLPPYRGKSLVTVLAWLAVTRLAERDAQVRWHLDRQQGPDSIAKILVGLSWTHLQKERNGREVVLHARLPAQAAPPAPEQFTAKVGARELTFDADYGVFSPRQVDEGTALLAEIALAESPVTTMSDIGVGYGPLAIVAVANDLAADAVATDVDSVALWLAQRNAARNGVRLSTVWSPDPLAAPTTELTLCNVPTHIDVRETEALLTALARRAAAGRLLIVVHSSIAHRYRRYFDVPSLSVRLYPGARHTVLRAAAK